MFYVYIFLKEIPTPTPNKPRIFNEPKTTSDMKGARKCNLKTDLYSLQPERLLQGGQNNPLKVCIL